MVVVVVVVGVKDPRNKGGTASPTRVRACLKYECADKGEMVVTAAVGTGGECGLVFIVRRGLEWGAA